LPRNRIPLEQLSPKIILPTHPIASFFRRPRVSLGSLSLALGRVGVASEPEAGAGDAALAIVLSASLIGPRAGLAGDCVCQLVADSVKNCGESLNRPRSRIKSETLRLNRGKLLRDRCCSLGAGGARQFFVELGEPSREPLGFSANGSCAGLSGSLGDLREPIRETQGSFIKGISDPLNLWR